MAKFPSLGDRPTAVDIMKMSPEASTSLLEMHEAIMRGPSVLSPGERELIAAYVSRLNKCQYCHGVHAETAKAFGIDAGALQRMQDSLDLAGFDEKMRSLLHYAGKVTQQPASVTDADARACYQAGWDEQALHDAVMVVCCFNFMNRLLEAHGVHGDPAMYKDRGPMLKEYGYLPLIRLLPGAR